MYYWTISVCSLPMFKFMPTDFLWRFWNIIILLVSLEYHYSSSSNSRMLYLHVTIYSISANAHCNYKQSLKQKCGTQNWISCSFWKQHIVPDSSVKLRAVSSIDCWLSIDDYIVLKTEKCKWAYAKKFLKYILQSCENVFKVF